MCSIATRPTPQRITPTCRMKPCSGSRDREAFAYFGWKPYMHNPSLRHWLHRIDIPTLLVWGAQDRFVSPEYAQRYAEAIPNSELQVVPEAGHYPHIERPEAVMDRVFQFVGSSRAQV